MEERKLESGPKKQDTKTSPAKVESICYYCQCKKPCGCDFLEWAFDNGFYGSR